VKPRRTVFSNKVFRLLGGNEDSDLWAKTGTDPDGDPVISTTWVPTDDERREIAAGHNIEVIVWGESHPAMAVRTDDSPLGKHHPTRA
jgi:hypothetical protein